MSRMRKFFARYGQETRYLLVGAWNTVIGYGAFLVALAVFSGSLRELADAHWRLVSYLGTYYYITVQWGVWAVMVVHSTLTLKYLAFRSPGRLLPQVAKSYLVYLPAQFLASFILWVTVDFAHLVPALGQMVTIVFVTVFTYLGHKHFTFRRTPGQ